jgi:hypothetical protein
MKICNTCSIQKNISEFYARKKDVRYNTCKTCWNKNSKLLYAKNKVRYNARKKQYKQEDKERWQEYNKSYYSKNAEKMKTKLWYQNNTERAKEYFKTLSKTPSRKAHANQQTAIRRATFYQRIPNWLSKKDKQEIKQIYLKAQLITEQTGIKHDVDHILPLRGKDVSGLHVLNNLQIIPKELNLKKGNKSNV